VLDGVGEFVELVRWVSVLESEVRLECFDPVLRFLSLEFVVTRSMRL
jgi:hypothetical protein